MENSKETKMDQIVDTLQYLNKGEVLLMSARKIQTEETDGWQLEFAEKINLNLNPLQIFNQGDSRFELGKARRAYSLFSKDGVKAIKGLDLDKIEDEHYVSNSGKEMFLKPIGIKNPTINYEGIEYKIKLQVVETTPSFEDLNGWQQNNIRKVFKQDGQGNFMLSDEKLIVSKIAPTVTESGKVKHILIQHDSTTTEPEEYLIPDAVIEKEEMNQEKVSSESSRVFG